MTKPFTNGMTKATELTRSGKLQEATALIQALLHSRPDDPATTDTVIDGDFTRLAAPVADPAGQTKATRPRMRSDASRSGLAETLRRIAAGGMPGPAAVSRTAPVVPPGACFLALTHATAQGSRDYRLYVPAKRPEAPMPLIVMLHGCTQNPEDFATGTGMNVLAEEFGCLIAYPAQPSGANAQKCWNWFRPEDQARGRGEPALIASLTQDILRDHGGDPARVYIAGLSAGGAAAIMAEAYPDLFSAVGVHSGLPVGAARDVASAFAAMRTGTPGKPRRIAVPTIAFHGLADATVHPQNGQALVTQALNAQAGLRRSADQGTSVGGRTFRRISHSLPDGRTMVEHWQIDGAGHAWAGGQAAGSYTDPKGPDASREMLRFFLQHAKP